MIPDCVCLCVSEYFYDQEEDEDAEPTFSEDEAVTQKGLRRSQSVKITRSRVRKDVSVKKMVINSLYKHYVNSVYFLSLCITTNSADTPRCTETFITVF